MNRTDEPSKQPKPFGINGQREDILPTTPPGDNTASYDSGFPPITMLIKSAGGKPPKGQDMNQILYELSSLARWSSAGTLNTYDSSFATAISGYPSGSIVISDDGLNIFISTIDGNTNNPNITTTGWESLSTFLGINDSRVIIVTTSQTITIPEWVTEIYVSGCAGGGGGGGGGGGDTTYYGAGGGGGGAGESIIKRKFTVPAGASLSITIGAAGVGANSSVGTGNDGNAGGNTVIGNLITLTGGGGGKGGFNTPTSGGTIGGGKGGTGYPNGASGSDGILTAGTAAGGVGSSTPFGGGGGNGRAVTIAAAESDGVNAYGYGSGGGGGGGKYGNASMGGGATAAGGSGGNGAPGIVIIEW